MSSKTQNPTGTPDVARKRRTVQPLAGEPVLQQEQAPPLPGALQRATTSLPRTRPADVLTLQRTIGNQAVSRLIQPPIQREEEDEIQAQPLLRRQADGSLAAGAAVEKRLAAQKGGGRPLSEKVRAFMEPRFGADLSGVRIHTGAEASQLSRDLQAKAFTHGRDIYMGSGQYAPGTDAGKRLLAHELTHTIQQMGGQAPPIQRVSKQTKKRIKEITKILNRRFKKTKLGLLEFLTPKEQNLIGELAGLVDGKELAKLGYLHPVWQLPHRARQVMKVPGLIMDMPVKHRLQVNTWVKDSRKRKPPPKKKKPPVKARKRGPTREKRPQKRPPKMVTGRRQPPPREHGLVIEIKEPPKEKTGKKEPPKIPTKRGRPLAKTLKLPTPKKRKATPALKTAPKAKSPYEDILHKIASYIESGKTEKNPVWTSAQLEKKAGKDSSKEYQELCKKLDTYHAATVNDWNQVLAKSYHAGQVRKAIQAWQKKNKPPLKLFRWLVKDKKKDRREALAKLEVKVQAAQLQFSDLDSAYSLQEFCQKAQRWDPGPPGTAKEAKSRSWQLHAEILEQMSDKPKELADEMRQVVSARITHLENLAEELETKAKEEKEKAALTKEPRKKLSQEWVDKAMELKGLTAKAGQVSMAEIGHKLEALDPYHRDYQKLYEWYEVWLGEATKAQSIKGFFDWVNKREKTKGKLPRIRYITQEAQRKKYKLGFKGPAPYYVERKQFYLAKGRETGEQKWLDKAKRSDKLFRKGIYVLTTGGEFYGRHETEERKKSFHHSSFVAGLPVSAAGAMSSSGGGLTVNLESGHYQPKMLHMLHVVRNLQKRGVDLSAVLVQPCDKSKLVPTDAKLHANLFLQGLARLKQTKGKDGGKLTEFITNRVTHSATDQINEQLREAYQAA